MRLLGITTVAGNQTVEKTTLNARRVCTAARHPRVPVAAGLSRPLHGTGIVAPDIHGESGLDGPGFGSRPCPPTNATPSRSSGTPCSPTPNR